MVEGLAASGAGGHDLDAIVAALDRREFVLAAAGDEPVRFTSRWAASYLRGPLTATEVARLVEAALPRPTAPAVPDDLDDPRTLGPDETPVAPEIAGRAVFLDPTAPWAEKVDADPASPSFEAGLVARVHLRFDERRADLDHRAEWEAVFPVAREDFDPSEAISVDHDDRDFRSGAPDGAIFVLPGAPLDEASYLRSARKKLADHLTREEDDPDPPQPPS